MKIASVDETTWSRALESRWSALETTNVLLYQSLAVFIHPIHWIPEAPLCYSTKKDMEGQEEATPITDVDPADPFDYYSSENEREEGEPAALIALAADEEEEQVVQPEHPSLFTEDPPLEDEARPDPSDGGVGVLLQLDEGEIAVNEEEKEEGMESPYSASPPAPDTRAEEPSIPPEQLLVELSLNEQQQQEEGVEEENQRQDIASPSPPPPPSPPLAVHSEEPQQHVEVQLTPSPPPPPSPPLAVHNEEPQQQEEVQLTPSPPPPLSPPLDVHSEEPQQQAEVQLSPSPPPSPPLAVHSEEPQQHAEVQLKPSSSHKQPVAKVLPSRRSEPTRTPIREKEKLTPQRAPMSSGRKARQKVPATWHAAMCKSTCVDCQGLQLLIDPNCVWLTNT